MTRLFQFLFKYRAFFIFLLLEVVCGWLIVNQNNYQRIAFLQSSGRIVGGITQTTDHIAYYFGLSSVNAQLAGENARLRDELTRYQQSLLFANIEQNPAPAVINQFHHEQAKVINNNLLAFQNYLTINKGRQHGVAAGMGVVGPNGVVGKVRAVSEHFATITSLLHADIFISASLGEKGSFGTLRWEGQSYEHAQLDFIPRHVQVLKGDQVLTSGYNAVFPPGVLIGTVDTVITEPNATFHNINVTLATDFSQLEYLYIIQNRLLEEKDSIESLVPNGN